MSRPISLDITKPPVSYKDASEETRFALSLVTFGLILRDSEYKGYAKFKMVYDLGAGVRKFDPFRHRAQFFRLVDKAESLRR